MAKLRIIVKRIKSQQVSDDEFENATIYRSFDIECPENLYKAFNEEMAIVCGAEFIKGES